MITIGEKITQLTMIGKILSHLNTKYKENQIEGLVIGVIYKDGTFGTASSDLDYLRIQGLAEVIKQDSFRNTIWENVE